MKVLVTGANGFIGKYVIDELLKIDDIQVIATSIELSLENKNTDSKRITYIQKDFNNYTDNFYEYFIKPDILIHLAWEGLPNYKELFHIEKNLFVNYKFLKNIIENGIKDVTIIGTCFEYGLMEGKLSEEMITKPVTCYGVAKDSLRKFIEQLNQKIDFSFKWIRLFYPYGEGQSEKSILSLLKKAVKNGEKSFNMSPGEQLRDYLKVETVAQYIVKIALQKEIAGIINCCSGNPISLRKFVENYLKENNLKIELNLGYYSYLEYEPMAFWGDRTKLNEVLNKKNG